MSEDNCCKAKIRNKGSDEHSPIVLSLLDERFEGGNGVFIKMQKTERLEIEDPESPRLLRKEITMNSAADYISNGSDVHSPTVSSLLLAEIFEGENDVFLKMQKTKRLESEDQESARLLGKEITKKSANNGNIGNDGDVNSPTLSSLSEEMILSEGENDVLQKMQKRLKSEDQESPRIIISITESKKKSEKEETKESLENNSEIMGWIPGIEIPGPIPDIDPIIQQQFNLHTILDDPFLDD